MRSERYDLIRTVQNTSFVPVFLTPTRLNLSKRLVSRLDEDSARRPCGPPSYESRETRKCICDYGLTPACAAQPATVPLSLTEDGRYQFANTWTRWGGSSLWFDRVLLPHPISGLGISAIFLEKISPCWLTVPPVYSIVFLAMSFARDFCSLFQYTAAQQCYQAGSGGCNTGGNNAEIFLVLADSSTCLSNGVSQFSYGLLSRS